jgi:Inorganic pyrophosphatase
MAHLRDIEDVSEFDRLEIHHFFEVYKALEPGKEVETATWVNRAAAHTEIEACRERARSVTIRTSASGRKRRVARRARRRAADAGSSRMVVRGGWLSCPAAHVRG